MAFAAKMTSDSVVYSERLTLIVESASFGERPKERRVVLLCPEFEEQAEPDDIYTPFDER